jgi:subtilase family serine protease
MLKNLNGNMESWLVLLFCFFSGTGQTLATQFDYGINTGSSNVSANTTNATTGTLTSADAAVTAAQPSLAPLSSADLSSAFEVREGHLPPAGYARPPFHIIPSFTNTTPTGLNPNQIRNFYGFDQINITNQGKGQTIAIIDAYDDPNIVNDVKTFISTLQNSKGLGTACNFSKNNVVYANGSKPVTNAGWALEMALDVEWACAIAPQATILLVEAASNSYKDLMHAIDVATQGVYINGTKYKASVVSMSWGGSEFSGETAYDFHFKPTGVIFTASSGDSGTGVEYPAASPYVVAVGGTNTSTDTEIDSTDPGPDIYDYFYEGAWSGSGGGISQYESAPPYQYLNVKLFNNSQNKRGVPDVAYDGDPNTGVAVYSSVNYNGQSGWFQIGGTSVGAPQWAALFAIANSNRTIGNLSTDPTSQSGSPIYNAAASYATNFHDITTGANGTCNTVCGAGAYYDYVTGLGSPQANHIVPYLVQ